MLGAPGLVHFETWDSAATTIFGGFPATFTRDVFITFNQCAPSQTHHPPCLQENPGTDG